MSELDAREALKSRFREIIAQQSRMLKVPTALEAVRQHCLTEIFDAVESFLLSWEQQQQQPSSQSSTKLIELPCGLVREAFSVLLSAVGPGDDMMRDKILSLLVAVQTTESRQVLLDVLPSAMPLDQDGLEKSTRQVLEALEMVLAKDWTAVMPVVGCLSILPFDDKGKRQVQELALANLSLVSESDLPVLIRTLLRHIATDADARLAIEALGLEMIVWETTRSEDDPDDEGVVALVIHIVLSSFQDSSNGDCIKAAYMTMIHNMVQTINDRIDEGMELKDDKDRTRLGILDTAALLVLREDSGLSTEAESAIDNLLRMNCFSFESLSSLLHFTFDRKRRKPSLLHDLLGSSLVSFCFFVLLFPVRSAMSSDASSVMQHTLEFVELLYHRLDMQRQRELVLGLVHLCDESSFSVQQKTPRKRGRPRDATCTLQIQQRRLEGINMTISKVHSILQMLAKSDRATLSRFKEMLMSRLTSTSTEAFDKGRQKLIQQLCTTLSSLVEPMHAEPGGGRGIDASEMLIFLQKLLFASSQRFHSQVLQEDGADVGRTIRGILLATELVKWPALSHGDKDCIQKWVLRILLPSTRRMVDPEVGWPGLCFFEAMAEQTTTGISQSKSELFSNLKMILANTGLIQMLAHYQQRKKANSGTILGYSTIPPHFLVQADTKNQRKKREMVFCFSIFMRHIDITNPHRWDCAVRWVFDLVNKYLRIGRELSGQTSSSCSPGNGRSKWMPHSWLQAAVELPILDIIDATGPLRPKIEGTLGWIRSKLCSHELSYDEHLCESIDVDIGDLLIEGKTPTQLRALCAALSRMALALLLSLGVAGAVLANTFEHYKIEVSTPLLEKGKEGSSIIGVEHQGLLRLLQYQLYKIYDLKEKCIITQKLLHVCCTSMRRRKSATKVIVKGGNRRTLSRPRDEGNETDVQSNNRSPTRTENATAIDNVTTIASDCESIVSQTLAIVTSLFASKDFVDPTILWECLADKDYDAAFDQVLPSRDGCSKSNASDYDFSHMIWIRECIMDHICFTEIAESQSRDGLSLADQLASSQMSRGVTSATISDFAHCFQQASKLLAMMPELRKIQSEKEEGVSQMVTCYLRIILRVLESTRSHASSDSHEPQHINVTYRECLEVCRTGLVATTVQEEVVPGDEAPSAEIAAFKNILSFLRKCEDAALSFLLMEILCLFTQRRKRELTDFAVDASWRDLHTVYSGASSTAHTSLIPTAFIDALRRFQQMSPQRNKTSERVLLATVVKAALNETREFTRNSLLRHSVLRHWGLIVLSLETTGFRHSIHVSKMITELQLYLNSINEVHRGDLVGPLSYRTNDPKNNDTMVSSIPGLTGSSFAIFYELILYVVLALFAVCPPSIVYSIESEYKRVSPYQHLHQMIQHFSQLVGLFRENLKLFPRRLFPIFLGCCNHMMKLTVRQVRCCVDWRNSRPLLSFKEKADGVDDLGSIRYLQDLLETCATHNADCIISFCKFISTQPRGSKYNDSDDSASCDEAGTSWAFAAYHKKIKALASSAENILFFLRETAASHNLILPHQLPSNKSNALSKDVKTSKLDHSDVGFHELTSRKRRFKKRIRPLPGSKHGPTYKGESEWDDSPSDESSLWSDDGKSVKGSSSSFGVAGDWGDDSDSAASSASLNLEAMDRVDATN